MLIAPPDSLLRGTLIRRFQRFLAEIRLEQGEIITAHTPNTGSMMQCAVPGHRVVVSRSPNPSRKLAYTLELVRARGRWVDVNTHRANAVVEEALQEGKIEGFEGWAVRREVRLGESRIDFMASKADRRCYIEVKSVTLTCGADVACFPDAVTERGAKHLRELMAAVKRGHQGMILFLVQRSEARSFRPADEIDPVYGRLLRDAVRKGVKAQAYKTRLRFPYIRLAQAIPVSLDSGVTGASSPRKRNPAAG